MFTSRGQLGSMSHLNTSLPLYVILDLDEDAALLFANNTCSPSWSVDPWPSNQLVDAGLALTSSHSEELLVSVESKPAVTTWSLLS